MKRILFLLFSAILVLGVMATPLCDKKIAVKSSNGTTEYAVSSVRSIKFSSGNVVMNLNDGASVAWASDAVGCMYFDYHDSTEETAVNEVTTQGFSFNGGVLSVKSEAPEQVILCTAEGKEVVNTTCKGALLLRLVDYPKGVYILKIDGFTYKIVNR